MLTTVMRSEENLSPKGFASVMYQLAPTRHPRHVAMELLRIRHCFPHRVTSNHYCDFDNLGDRFALAAIVKLQPKVDAIAARLKTMEPPSNEEKKAIEEQTTEPSV